MGKVVEASGGPYILSESRVLAEGLMNMFLRGKQYNRCKRSHIMLASCLHGLQFKQLLTDFDFDLEFQEDLLYWIYSGNERSEQSLALKEMTKQYVAYCNDSLNGLHGKTAQFWMQYCHLVELYLILHRAVKINDINLHRYVLFEISALFFSTNHVNYAGWMVLHDLELFNLDFTHPGVAELLKNGAFSVRRSAGKFSRVGVDMALEESINAHAKNK